MAVFLVCALGMRMPRRTSRLAGDFGPHAAGNVGALREAPLCRLKCAYASRQIGAA
jgi:hypothetical protein